MSEKKFTINLQENGEHSFKKSLESYEEYEKTKDQMLLKDTIMFLHQSIELLMKQMLVKHSEYLIFEDLKDIPNKQREAGKKGTGIFFIDHPPRTVTYEVAIDRVDAFLNPPGLDDVMKKNLKKLNSLRNQLEHYAIDADRNEIIQVLEAIQQPILTLFEQNLGYLVHLHTPRVKRGMEVVEDAFKEAKLKNELKSLIGNFNGQKVPGTLLGVEEEVTLPKFDFLYEDYRLSPAKDENFKPRYIADILAGTQDALGIGPGIRWLVEINLRLPDPENLLRVNNNSKLINASSWLVVHEQIPVSLRNKARGLNIMVTGFQEYEELKKLLEFIPPINSSGI